MIQRTIGLISATAAGAALALIGCTSSAERAPTSVMDVGSGGANYGPETPGMQPASPTGKPVTPFAPASTPFRRTASVDLDSDARGKTDSPAVEDDANQAAGRTASPDRGARATVQTSASVRFYTVQKGDTLSSIARVTYGNASEWKQIAKANPGVVASALRVGQKLNLP